MFKRIKLIVVVFTFTYMKSQEITIRPATQADMPFIDLLAKKFELDCENMELEQFVTAKRRDEIIGFGRLRKHSGPKEMRVSCTELATVGVIPQERKKGIGIAIVNELLRAGPSEIFVTCVIPDFFSRFGFKPVKKYPPALQKKVDFCKSFDFCEEQIFVMKRVTG